jgi:hypothetical protein
VPQRIEKHTLRDPKQRHVLKRVPTVGYSCHRAASSSRHFDASAKTHCECGFTCRCHRVAIEEEQAKRIYVDPAWIAGDYAVLGDKDRAFSWLEKAYREKSGGLPFIKSAPVFDSLQSDPRYADFLKRMGLPPQHLRTVIPSEAGRFFLSASLLPSGRPADVRNLSSMLVSLQRRAAPHSK